MSTAQVVFVAYGVIIMVVGFAFGSLLGVLRMKAPAARNLAVAHVETLMQAALHLALAFTVGAVGFDNGAATVGAWLLVAASSMQTIGATLNWLKGVGDQFAERSLGFYCNSVATFAALPGIGIVAVGVLGRL